ncbi:hypothetical protein BKA70DRAFT_1397447 [Coprinopsis sp. MPI-PUGE-AT-0042]|nr:hypothetical protein BKA70DRAFT_1397447 [Coprinopsis sp. MPI-PUGE-AT-0042]
MNIQHHQSLPQRRSIQPRRESAHPAHSQAAHHYLHGPRMQGTLTFPVRNVNVPATLLATSSYPSAISNFQQLDPRAIAHLTAAHPSTPGFSAHQLLVLQAHDTASDKSTWEFTASKKSKRKSIQKPDGRPTEAQRVAMEYLQAQAHRQTKPLPPIQQSGTVDGRMFVTSDTRQQHKNSTARPGLDTYGYSSSSVPRARRSSSSAADRPALLPSNSHQRRSRRNSTTAAVQSAIGHPGIPNLNPPLHHNGQLALPTGFQPTGLHPFPQAVSRSRRTSSSNPGLTNNLAIDDSRSRRTSIVTTSKHKADHHNHSHHSSSNRSRKQSVSKPSTDRKSSHDRSHKHDEKPSTKRSSSKSRGSSRERKTSRLSRYGPFSIGAEALAREEAHTVMDRFKAHEMDPLPCRRDGCPFQANNVESLGVHILNAHVSEPAAPCHVCHDILVKADPTKVRPCSACRRRSRK